MAKKKKLEPEIKSLERLENEIEFEALRNFKGQLNNKVFDFKKGDIYRVSPNEYQWLIKFGIF